MDYKRLNSMAKVEGRDALRERLERILKQADEARERNDGGNIPDGLSRGIRSTRYMLDKTVSDEPGQSTINGDNGAHRSAFSAQALRDHARNNPPENDGRIRKFGEGVEMLMPTLHSVIQCHYSGYQVKAYEIYEGRTVRRNKKGAPVISPETSYVVVGFGMRFDNSYLHLRTFETGSKASRECRNMVYNVEDDMRRSSRDDYDY